MKIAILNGGGDCAGLNAVIASVVKSGLPKGHEFIGIKYGFEGLLGDPRYMQLDQYSVRGISHLGGTILYTTNKGRFAAKVGSGETNQIPQEILLEAKANIEKLGIDYLVVIGGDGTLSGALQLSNVGVRVVGVPKTIDNDLNYTDRTFGYSSAVDVITESMDRIHTTAVSHGRVMLVEAMGRHTGWLALAGGIAGGAHVILIPEIPFNYTELAEFLKRRQQTGRNYTIISVAEGAHPEDGDVSFVNAETGKESQLGGITEQIIAQLKTMLPSETFEMRNVVLGHTQRGGSPNPEDRILAKRFGIAAMETIEAGLDKKMVTLIDGKITTVDIADAVGDLKRVTLDSDLVKTAKSLGIFIGKN